MTTGYAPQSLHNAFAGEALGDVVGVKNLRPAEGWAAAHRLSPDTSSPSSGPSRDLTGRSSQIFSRIFGLSRETSTLEKLPSRRLQTLRELEESSSPPRVLLVVLAVLVPLVVLLARLALIVIVKLALLVPRILALLVLLWGLL